MNSSEEMVDDIDEVRIEDMSGVTVSLGDVGQKSFKNHIVKIIRLMKMVIQNIKWILYATKMCKGK